VVVRIGGKDNEKGRMMRKIILDTEIIGLEPSEGHRIIEIGCKEPGSQAAIFFVRRMG